MAVRLRLRRTGTRNKACYRIVAADGRSPRDGRFIEIIGYYDPRHQDEKIDIERAEYWIQHGAQPSNTVAHVIRRAKELPKETAVSEPEIAVPAAEVEDDAGVGKSDPGIGTKSDPPEPSIAKAKPTTDEVSDDAKADSEIESEGDPEPSKTEAKATSDDKQEAEDAHPDTSVSADVAKESAPSDVAKKSETP